MENINGNKTEDKPLFMHLPAMPAPLAEEDRGEAGKVPELQAVEVGYAGLSAKAVRQRRYLDKLKFQGLPSPKATWKQRCRESFLCYNCGKDSVSGTGYKLCAKCRERYRDTRKGKQHCHIPGCISPIGASASRKKRYCEQHYAEFLANQRSGFAKRREQGICVSCGRQPPVDGYTACQPCKDDSNRRGRQKRQLLKLRVIQHYGGACACCGESHIDFLTMDHINNNGKAHRRSFGGQNDGVYRDLVKRWPDDMQVLCYNCNSAKEYFGMCPHERQKLGLPEIDYSDRNRWKDKISTSTSTNSPTTRSAI